MYWESRVGLTGNVVSVIGDTIDGTPLRLADVAKNITKTDLASNNLLNTTITCSSAAKQHFKDQKKNPTIGFDLCASIFAINNWDHFVKSISQTL